VPLSLGGVADWRGSTRSLALLRIALGLVVWAEYGREATLWEIGSLERQVWGVLLLPAAGAMVAGWRSAWSTGATAALLLVGYYGFGVAGGIKEPFVHAHTFLLMTGVVLLALSPCGRSLSVDRWLAVRRGDAPREEGFLFPLWLMRVQLSLVYLFGAFDKTHEAFLSGMRLRQIGMYYLGSHEGVRIPLADELAFLAGTGTVVLEYALAIGLWTRARAVLIPLGMAFHFAIYLGMPVASFSVLTIAWYLAYLDPERVHRALGEVVRS